MRLCPKCWRTYKGNRRSYCPDCQSEYCKAHYRRNKKKHNKRRYLNNIKYRNRNRKFINSLKKKCFDCNRKYPSYVLDFDHRDPKLKSFMISHAVERAYSLEVIKSEIAKCDLVCANCHRIRTHGV